MLIELEITAEKALAFNTRIDECIAEHGDSEGIFESWRVVDGKSRRLQQLDDYPMGFYYLGINGTRNISDLTNYKVTNDYHSFSPDDLEEMYLLIKKNKKLRNNYGICDNYKQILKEYPELKKSKERKFVVELSLHTKENDPGFRWHKNGKYIGKKKPQCECLGDENFSQVISYHIYEVEKESGN